MDNIELFAKKLAGNWKEFQCFVWSKAYDHEIRDSSKWGIVYTSNRDSGLIELSNESTIKKMMKRHIDRGNAFYEHHNHWAVGYLDGYSIRVYDTKGKITQVLKTWYEIQCQLDNYPILDEDDYYNREYDATIENIESALSLSDIELIGNLPDDYIGQIYSWFSENDESAIENTDDNGGYPSDDQLCDACLALGFTGG